MSANDDKRSSEAARMQLVANNLTEFQRHFTPSTSPDIISSSDYSTITRSPIHSNTNIEEHETIVHEVDGMCILQAKQRFPLRQTIIYADCDPTQIQARVNHSRNDEVEHDRGNKNRIVNKKNKRKDNIQVKIEMGETGKQLEANKKMAMAHGAEAWTISQVADFVKYVTGNNEIVKKFIDEEIDGYALLRLRIEHLHSILGVKFGPSVKLSHHIEKLQKI